MAVWQLKKTDANIELMMEIFQWPASLCRVLANRQLRDKHSVIRYFHPKLESMHDARQLPHIEAAIERVVLAIANEELITVYGDYDVDGVMSTVILVKALAYLGARVSYAMPDREMDGYGLNEGMVQRLSDEGAELLITVDNGIAAFDEIELANRLHIDVIVLDHHEPPAGLTLEAIVVNAKLPDSSYPFRELCAAGLVYKFVELLFMTLTKELPYQDEWLIFAAIATICDMVPLLDENRVIVTEGLKRLHRGQTGNIGLQAFLEGLQLHDRDISPRDVGFLIGPTINATGRIAHASLAVDLFLSQNVSDAKQLVNQMMALNQERQAITQQAISQALLALEEENDDVVKIFYLPSMHESVAGIVAGRLKEELSLPVIMLTDGLHFVKGSGRSIYPYDMFRELEKQKDLFIHFGGHTMAAGLSIEKENIDTLRRNLNDHCTFQKEDFVPLYEYDDTISLQDVDLTLGKQIAFMAPFGMKNEKPQFMWSNLQVLETRILGKNKNTLKWLVEQNGYQVAVIGFGKMTIFERFYVDQLGQAAWDTLFSIGKNDVPYTLDILGTVEINFFRQQQTIQIQMIDFR